MKKVRVRLGDDVYQRIAAEADKQGMQPSEVIARSIYRAIGVDSPATIKPGRFHDPDNIVRVKIKD